MRPVLIFATAATLALAVVTASAQPIISAKSGVIAGVEGKVLIDKTEVVQSETHFPEVKEGSVLSTQEGRVELMLPPGFMLRMGENGSLKMLANRLVDTRVELQAGSAVVEVAQASPDYNVAIALKDGVVNLSKMGVYRFDTEPARIKVFQGNASVQIGGQTIAVTTGKMLALQGDAAAVEKFDVEQTDALDNWSRRQAQTMAMANASGARYGTNPTAQQKNGGTWSYNPYFDLYTYIPYYGRMCNPYYGVCYYSPAAAYQTFYAQPAYIPPPTMGGGGSPSYTQMSGTSSGTASSVMSAPSSASSAPSMASSSSTSAAASSASSGHGSAASGGHGK